MDYKEIFLIQTYLSTSLDVDLFTDLQKSVNSMSIGFGLEGAGSNSIFFHAQRSKLKLKLNF